MPSLQKAPDAIPNYSQATHSHQQMIQQQHHLAKQKLLQFQEDQREQFKKFATEQKEKFDDFQKSLGVSVSLPILHYYTWNESKNKIL